jgi:uncharacterized membrane protein YuzA (DUF378 family)
MNLTIVSDIVLEFLQKPEVLLIAELVVILAAINLLSVGLLNVDYISRMSGDFTKYVFILIGLCGLFLLYKKAMLMKANML